VEAYTYASPAEVHLHYQNVTVPGPLGALPAWYVPGTSHTWVLLVHGYNSERDEGVRPMPTLVRLGLPILDLSYRNDVGAPASSDRLYHLGATEWQDLQAGVRYARAHGARDVVLYGYSMGGGIVESFLHHSSYAPYVRAAVLDAPALDWSAVLDLAAGQRHLPGILTSVSKWIVARRLGMSNLDSLDQVRVSAGLKAPTLLFHGTDDTRVPFGPSAALAHARPDIVTFVPVRAADHTQEWNVNPSAYTAHLKTFLERHMR
jgi:alpha-beta hydrolase superfamily lysophospholipase